MKFLLTPITIIIWFLVTYLSIYYGLYLLVWMFSLHWLLLLILFTFLSGVLSFLVYTLPSLIQMLIIEFYNRNWFIVVIHSFTGLIAFAYFYLLLYEHPPALFDGVNAVPLLKGMWEQSWLKSFILVPTYIFLHFTLLYFTVINPIVLKFQSK